MHAFVFAGQGDQVVGMGKALCASSPGARALFDRASAILGFDLAKVCFEGPAEQLTRTDVCQPALLVHAYAAAQDWAAKHGAAPAAVAGLSLGEYTAEVFAGALAFEEGVRLVRLRGQFMQEACDKTPSGMVAVLGLDRAKVKEAADWARRFGIVGVANCNAPGQTILSGAKEPLAKAADRAKELGAKRCLPLNVAGAYHSDVMKPAQEKLQAELAKAEFSKPRMPVVCNATGTATSDPEELRRNLATQVVSSVLWEDCVRTMQSMGVTTYVEFGPKQTLAGLIGKIHPGAEATSVGSVAAE
jgi:[acyl-carrier-protein] S-malonyltransferase